MAFLSLLALVLAVLATALTGWRRERHLLVWELALGRAARLELDAETRSTRRQLDTIDDTYRLAHMRRRRGEFNEAVRLLNLACRTVEAFVPGRVARLREMIRMSRAVSAMLPARTLPWPTLRLGSLASLAAARRLLHPFLVTTGERFRLRVRLLVYAFGLVLRSLRRHTQRAAHAERSWRRIDDLRMDLAELNSETLDCYRAVLASLEREELLAFAASVAH